MVKLRTALFVIFISYFCLSDVFAFGPGLPLPVGTVKISEKKGQGPMKSLTKKYASSLDKDALTAFYSQQMLKAGWTEHKGGSFIKGDDLAVLIISPAKYPDGKTGFYLSTFKLDKKRSFSDRYKKNPDKLKFMPVYPGSVQHLLWNFPNGYTLAKYSAPASVKDGVFFYKAQMLNYGWSLESENVAEKKAKTTQINLVFRKSNKEKHEICKIRIGQVPSRNRISISATYYVQKAIKLPKIQIKR